MNVTTMTPTMATSKAFTSFLTAEMRYQHMTLINLSSINNNIIIGSAAKLESGSQLLVSHAYNNKALANSQMCLSNIANIMLHAMYCMTYYHTRQQCYFLYCLWSVRTPSHCSGNSYRGLIHYQSRHTQKVWSLCCQWHQSCKRKSLLFS